MKGVRLSPEEIEVINRACERVGASFSDFARAAMVTAALYVLGALEGATSEEVIARLQGSNLTLLGFAGVQFTRDGKARLLFHTPVEVGEVVVKRIKSLIDKIRREVEKDEREARAEAAG
jgi:hypothetical protein